MKHILPGCIVLLSLLGPDALSQKDKETATSDFMYHMFEKKTEEWMKIFNSGKADDLSDFYTEDAVYVTSDVPDMNITGRKELVRYMQGSIDRGTKMDALKIISLDISGDLATVYCSFTMIAPGVTSRGRNIMLLRRSGIKWHIFLHMVVTDS